MITRRKALQTTLLSAAAMSLLRPGSSIAADPTPAISGPFSLPPLGYAFDALEPHIDAETMQLHHDKHHANYVSKLNEAVAAMGGAPKSIEELLTGLSSVPEAQRKAVQNNGGGHYNHSLFWQMLRKDGGQPSDKLAVAIQKTFGSEEAFWTKFSEAATKQFGSGWAWLAVSSGKELSVISNPNQDSPISDGHQVLLGLDVWEHAYYLKYRNKRADYIAAFPKIVNWEFVNARFEKFKA